MGSSGYCPCGQTYFGQDIYKSPGTGYFVEVSPSASAPDYEPLRAILDEAFKRASEGKGRTRHANGFPFVEQPLMMIMRGLGDGGVNGALFQACKKIMEIKNLRGEAKVAELEDAIVYLAAAVIYLRELENKEKP